MNVPDNSPEPRLRKLFLDALDIADPVERGRFLTQACAGDAGLLKQVNALLAQHKADSFLEQPAVQAANPVDAATLDSGATRAAPAKLPANAAPSTIRYFGDYELLEEIARGGMGVVFKARQKSLNRIVAVKMILAGKFANDDDVKRFRTEAEAAANLQHPNIVAIHEVGEHDGRHYFSMDFVEGRDLAQLVKAGPLPVAQAARYVQAIAGAIAYAHARGTLHRDLKPHNVLIDQHDQPRITDFGLAKLTKQDSSITQEGTVMGSPSYMPPEQAAGRQAQVGPHSDVYSIGAVLYHLLTGRAPFIGATAVETLRQVMDDEPVSPTKLNAKVPADLETICLKCLRKEPAQRYKSAQEVADELGRFLNYEPIHARPADAMRKVAVWGRKHPWKISAALAFVVLALIGVTYGLWEQTRFLKWQQDSAPLRERHRSLVERARQPEQNTDALKKEVASASRELTVAKEKAEGSIGRKMLNKIYEPLWSNDLVNWSVVALVILLTSFLTLRERTPVSERKRLGKFFIGFLAVLGVTLVLVGVLLAMGIIRAHIWWNAPFMQTLNEMQRTAGSIMWPLLFVIAFFVGIPVALKVLELRDEADTRDSGSLLQDSATTPPEMRPNAGHSTAPHMEAVNHPDDPSWTLYVRSLAGVLVLYACLVVFGAAVHVYLDYLICTAGIKLVCEAIREYRFVLDGESFSQLFSGNDKLGS